MGVTYCTAADVRAAVDFPSTGAPIDDSTIEEFILESEEEIQDVYKTFFGADGADSTATSGTTTSLTDTTQSWTADEWKGYVVWVYEGTGAGQFRQIASNTTDTLVPSVDFGTAPDATSKYRILKLGYADETVDGTGINEQFVTCQPLINLNTVTINSTAVTPTSIYQYKESGRLRLSSSSEVSFFDNTEPQLVDFVYIYGVYPFPLVIKRLCVLLAGIRTLSAQVAGTYDDFTSVSLPAGFQASKGEPYVNIINALDRMQREAKGIVYGMDTDQLGADWRKLPSYRPYTLFG